jgi:two-component system chemotaxis response regulator CheB
MVRPRKKNEQKASARGHDIIVIGCSAGGVETLPKLLARFPKGTPAAFFVVMHVNPVGESFLPRILGRATQLPAHHARDGEQIASGRIYVAPPDHHRLLVNGKIVLSVGPKENRHRPAVDPLFRSAAVQFTSRVIGVILSGAMDDGTAGLQAVKRCGGITVVQHPDDALASGMPLSALRSVSVDHCLPVKGMGTLLRKLIQTAPGPSKSPGCDKTSIELINTWGTMSQKSMEEQFGPPSGFVCPECNGPIWQVEDGRVTQFRCLVGHAYSPESFVADEGAAVERALWVAVKILQERADLLNRLAGKAAEVGQSITSSSFKSKAEECQAHSEAVRGILKRFENSKR